MPRSKDSCRAAFCEIFHKTHGVYSLKSRLSAHISMFTAKHAVFIQKLLDTLKNRRYDTVYHV